MQSTERIDDEESYRFCERPNAGAHTFDFLPPDSTRKDFLEHVKKTGRPDTWSLHVHTKPPRGGTPPRIIEKFVIPESLRPGAGKAPCPICSIRGEKYFAGMLAWFPDEKCLRAIGEECGKRFYGAESFERELNRYDDKKSDDAAIDFLINNFPKLPALREFIEEARHVARSADEIRTKFRNVIGKGVATRVVKLAAGGSLTLYDERQVAVLSNGNPVFDTNDEQVFRPERFLSASFRVEGLDALRDIKIGAEALLQRALNTVSEYELNDEGAIENKMIELDVAGRAQAQFNLRSAWVDSRDSAKLIRDVRELFQPENLAELFAWSSDYRCPVRFIGEVERNGIIRLGRNRLNTIRMAVTLPKVSKILPAFDTD